MFVSVDIGGTQIRVALVDEQFQILGKKSSVTGFDSCLLYTSDAADE